MNIAALLGLDPVAGMTHPITVYRTDFVNMGRSFCHGRLLSDVAADPNVELVGVYDLATMPPIPTKDGAVSPWPTYIKVPDAWEKRMHSGRSYDTLGRSFGNRVVGYLFVPPGAIKITI